MVLKTLLLSQEKYVLLNFWNTFCEQKSQRNVLYAVNFLFSAISRVFVLNWHHSHYGTWKCFTTSWKFETTTSIQNKAYASFLYTTEILTQFIKETSDKNLNSNMVSDSCYKKLATDTSMKLQFAACKCHGTDFVWVGTNYNNVLSLSFWFWTCLQNLGFGFIFPDILVAQYLFYNQISSRNIRSSHRRCSIKKLFLKILLNSKKSTCVRVSF